MNIIEALENALQNIAGHSVCLLGSAPHAAKPAFEDDAKIASVNGSHKAFGLSHVDVLFVNSYSFKGVGPVNIAVKNAVGQLSCGSLIYVDAADLKDVPSVSHDRGCRIDKTNRSQILEWATGMSYHADAKGNDVPSTGITAALILRKLGCDVTLHGFSLSDGHALLDGSPRMHKKQDTLYLPQFRLADEISAHARPV